MLGSRTAGVEDGVAEEGVGGVGTVIQESWSAEGGSGFAAHRSCHADSKVR